MSNVAGVLLKEGTAYPSRAPEFTPVIFVGINVAHLFSFCVVLLCVFASYFRIVVSVTMSA